MYVDKFRTIKLFLIIGFSFVCSYTCLGLSKLNMVKTFPFKPSVNSSRKIIIGQNDNYVMGRIIEYLHFIVANSQQHSPAFVNAAHGGFRDAMQLPAENTYNRPSDVALNGDDLALFNIYISFYQSTQNQFSKANVCHGDFDAPGQTLPDLMPTMVPDLLLILQQVPGYVGTAAEVASLTIEVTGIKNQLQKHVAINGCHMNGWISVGIKDGAQATINQINAIQWSDPRIINIVTVWKAMLQTLANSNGGLTTEGHNPWLRAQWQVSYQILLEATIEALKHMPPSSNRTDVLLYTFDSNEVIRDKYVNPRLDGTAFYVYPTQVNGTVTLYRWSLPNTYLYSIDPDEIQRVGWPGAVAAGPVGYVWPDGSHGGVPVYRIGVPSLGFVFTTNPHEYDNTPGAVGAGVVFYVDFLKTSENVPFYRYKVSIQNRK